MAGRVATFLPVAVCESLGIAEGLGAGCGFQGFRGNSGILEGSAAWTVGMCQTFGFEPNIVVSMFPVNQPEKGAPHV